MAPGMQVALPTTTRASRVVLSRKACFSPNSVGPSPIRLVNDIGPVKGSDNPDIVCGLSAQKAAMVVPANPGSVLSIQWVGGGGQAVSCASFFHESF